MGTVLAILALLWCGALTGFLVGHRRTGGPAEPVREEAPETAAYRGFVNLMSYTAEKKEER